MIASRTAWVKLRAIARAESRLYVRGVALWVSLLLILAFTVWSSGIGTTRTLELFLSRSEAVPVLLAAFALTLLITAGIAREEREAFDDVWRSLPVRNGQQYWGKLAAASGPALIVGAGLIALLPAGWMAVGTVWTGATTQLALAYAAQSAGILFFSIGVAGFLRGAVRNLRLRYVLGLLIVVGLAIVQALGIDNEALWAVLFSPYMLSSLPYDQSVLFGMWPWGPAVAWHVVFQAIFSAVLLLAGRALYERRRDPGQKSLGVALAIALLCAGALVPAWQYMAFWSEARATFEAQLRYDTKPNVVIPEGLLPVPTSELRRMPVTHVRVLGYDLRAEAAGDGYMRVTAEVELAANENEVVWPLTLHHQWRVNDVRGAGVRGWSREGNFIRLNVEPGGSPVRVAVEYEGKPFTWDWQIGSISPAHFMSEQGGYLSPLMAWYPIPGERRLAREVYGGDRRWLWLETEPLVPGPVPMRVRWSGPDERAVISNLPLIREDRTGGRTERVFEGESDGIAVLAGPLALVEAGGFALAAAESLTHGAEVLEEPYEMLVGFFEELVGRELPREPIVAVPGWLSRFYNPPVFWAIAQDGSLHYNRILTHLGAAPVVREDELASAFRAAERWRETGSVEALGDAVWPLVHAVLHAMWGRPHTFRGLDGDAVAQGLAQYSLLRWWERLSGAEAYASVRQAVRDRTLLRNRTGREAEVQEVLALLVEIEERRGESAVRALLGAVYDDMARRAVTLEALRELAARVTGEAAAGEAPGARGEAASEAAAEGVPGGRRAAFGGQAAEGPGAPGSDAAGRPAA